MGTLLIDLSALIGEANDIKREAERFSSTLGALEYLALRTDKTEFTPSADFFRQIKDIQNLVMRINGNAEKLK